MTVAGRGRSGDALGTVRDVVKILVVDDHPIVLEGARAAVGKHPDYEIVAEARNGLEAVQVAEKVEPDVVVMDISMPVMNGIEATRRILEKSPQTKIVVLSMHRTRKFVLAALEAGARGYLLKERTIDNLLMAMDTVMAEQIYLSPEVAETVVEVSTGRVKAEKQPLTTLSARECEVLRLIAEGRSNKEIAGDLCVSVKTVSTHRQHIMDKLDIHNVVGLTRYAIECGLTQVDQPL
jgi:two-component system nitrate/nitrite response regulator NarL